MTIRKPFWVKEHTTQLGQVFIAGLNTCLLSFDDDDGKRDDKNKPNLALGKRQFLEALPAEFRDALLLVLQHHPPDWLNDGDELQNILQSRPHILFCGHVHKQRGSVRFSFDGDALLQLDAGAGHVERSSPPEHAYAWGCLSPTGLTYFPRIWVEDLHRFRPDHNHHPDMKENGAVFIAREQLPPALRNWLPPVPPGVPEPSPIPSDQKLTESASKGFIQLSELMQSPQVRDAVGMFRDDFETTRDKIRVLKDHKDLHDKLDNLQTDVNFLDRYSFPGVMAIDTWKLHGMEVGKIASCLRDIAQRPSFTTDDSAYATSWIQDDVEEGCTKLNMAIENLDVNLFEEAISTLRRVLNIHPTNIDSHLSQLAGSLPLGELVKAMENVRLKFISLKLDSEQVKRFNESLNALIDLKRRLSTLIRDHKKWQILESNLKWIQDNIEQDVKVLEFSWQSLKTKGADLCNGSVYEQDSDFINFIKESAALDRAINEGNPISIKPSFGLYHRQAQMCLNHVDQRLKDFLDELQRIGESLEQVIRVMQ